MQFYASLCNPKKNVRFSLNFTQFHSIQKNRGLLCFHFSSFFVYLLFFVPCMFRLCCVFVNFKYYYFVVYMFHIRSILYSVDLKQSINIIVVLILSLTTFFPLQFIERYIIYTSYIIFSFTLFLFI